MDRSVIKDEKNSIKKIWDKLEVAIGRVGPGWAWLTMGRAKTGPGQNWPGFFGPRF